MWIKLGSTDNPTRKAVISELNVILTKYIIPIIILFVLLEKDFVSWLKIIILVVHWI